jgi:hypothetical protein
MNDGESYAVVGLAIGGDQQVTVGGIRNGIYRDAFTGGEVTVRNGSLAFEVRGNSAGIWVLNGQNRRGRSVLAVSEPGYISRIMGILMMDAFRRLTTSACSWLRSDAPIKCAAVGRLTRRFEGGQL